MVIIITGSHGWQTWQRGMASQCGSEIWQATVGIICNTLVSTAENIGLAFGIRTGIDLGIGIGTGTRLGVGLGLGLGLGIHIRSCIGIRTGRGIRKDIGP